MSPQRPCPPLESLRLAAEGRLSPDEQEHITHHVADCPACRETLSALRTGKFLGPIPPPPDDLGLPHIPGYEPLAELGRGGMGVVYKALQVALNRVVAVKMILEGGDASPELRQRFRAEAEAAARLAHPNVVQVYEVGEHAGRTFLALEFVAGNSLARKLGGKPVSAAEAAALVEPLARAVQHAHERGVVHRDLKPANVLLSVGQAFQPDSSKDVRLESLTYVPKITDFGLARRLDIDLGQTRSGVVLGTPSYMAPEQAQGERAGPLADVYGLGAILYECLTGRPPFLAATASGTLAQVLTADPVPPSRLQPGLPRDLEAICLKCLEKEPHRRYADAAALADDLGRFRRGEPTRARPLGMTGRVWRWARRRPLPATLLVLLAMALVGGLAGVLWQWRRAERARQAAQRNYDHALRAAQTLVTGIVEGVQPIAGTQAPTVRRVLNEAAAVYDRLLEEGETPALLAGKATMLTSFVRVYLDLNDSTAARVCAEEAVALFKDLCEQEPGNPSHQAGLARGHTQLGRVLLEQGHLGRAREELRRAEAVAGPLWEADPEQVDALLDLLDVRQLTAAGQSELADHEGALRTARAALALAEGLARRVPKHPRGKRLLAVLHEQVGDARYEGYDIDGAVLAYESAIRGYEGLKADDTTATGPRVDLARACQSLAGVFFWKGDAVNGRKNLERARQEAEALTRQDPANVQWRRLLLGSQVKLAGYQPDSAARQLELLGEMEALTRRYAEQDRARVRWQGDLASIFLLRGRAYLTLAGSAKQPAEDHRRAVEAFRAGLAIVEPLTTRATDNPNFANQWFTLSYLSSLALAGLKEGEQSARVALAAWQKRRTTCERLCRLYPDAPRWLQDRAVSERMVGTTHRELAGMKIDRASNLRLARQALTAALGSCDALLDREPCNPERIQETASAYSALAALEQDEGNAAEHQAAKARADALNELAAIREKATARDAVACQEDLYRILPTPARAVALARACLEEAQRQDRTAEKGRARATELLQRGRAVIREQASRGGVMSQEASALVRDIEVALGGR